MTQQARPAEPISEQIVALLGRCAACRLWAEQDEGPYHRDAQPLRRDIIEDREGVPLQLGMRLTIGDASLAGADVEIWHCDALGRYSGFPPPESTVTVTAATASRAEYLPDDTFLRGRQITDADGMVEFHTIYPGWYPGRTVHIHVIVHTAEVALTTQLYFPDHVNNAVLDSAPYRDRPGRDTTNDTDTILPTGGEPGMVDVEPDDGGYRAAICLIVPAVAVGASA